jgi:hypothetical protein
MTDLDFSTEEILEQARGDSAGLWHVAVRWARERDGSVDDWASFVGRAFAPSWDSLGDDASALVVARQVGLIMAGQGDMRPKVVSGDAARAEMVAEGPDPEYLEQFGTTMEDIDRAQELVHAAIANGRGMTLECRRDGSDFHMTFARR